MVIKNWLHKTDNGSRAMAPWAAVCFYIDMRRTHKKLSEKRVALLHKMDITVTHTRNYITLLGVPFYLRKMQLDEAFRFIGDTPLT